MIGAALWTLAYLMIATAVYLHTEDWRVSAVAPLVAQLIIVGVARITVSIGVGA